MFKRLPLDNFPDDTESIAFQSYPDVVYESPIRSVLQRHWRWLISIGGLVSVLVIIVTQFPTADDPSEPIPTSIEGSTENINTVPTPQPEPLVMIGNMLPVEVFDRHEINIPTRIDDFAALGVQRAYVFFSPATITWQIGVLGAQTDFSIELYTTNTTTPEFATNTMTAVLTEGQLYAVVVSSLTNNSGYTFTILPSQ